MDRYLFFLIPFCWPLHCLSFDLWLLIANLGKRCVATVQQLFMHRYIHFVVLGKKQIFVHFPTRLYYEKYENVDIKISAHDAFQE